MKPLRACIVWLLIASQASAEIAFEGPSGGGAAAYYALLQYNSGASFKGFQLPEGSSGALGRYAISDAALVTAGITSTDGDYNFRIFAGTVADTPTGNVIARGTLGWTGTVERPLRSNVTYFGNLAGSFSFGRPQVLNASRMRTIFVSSLVGSDSNAGLTYDTPKLTLVAAVAILRAGGRLYIRTGDYRSEGVIDLTAATKDNCFIEGQGVGLVTTDGWVAEHGTSFRGFHIDAQDAITGQGIVINLKQDVTVDGMLIDAPYDGIYALSSKGARITRSVVNSPYDPINISNGKEFLIDGCALTSSATYGGTPTAGRSALVAAYAARGVVSNTTLELNMGSNYNGTSQYAGVCDIGSSNVSFGDSAESSLFFHNVTFKGRCTSTSHTGELAGLHQRDLLAGPMRATLSECRFDLIHSNAGAVVRQINAPTGSVVMYDGHTNVDTTKVVTAGSAIVKCVPFDIDTTGHFASGTFGEAIVDGAAAYTATQDATNGLAAIKTAAAAVKTVTDKVATMLEADNANFKLTEDALAEAPTGGSGGVVIPVSQVHVPPARTWGLKQDGTDLVGEFPIGAMVGTSKLYKIDFAKDLATNGQLDSITSIVISSGDEDGLTFADGEDDQGIDTSGAIFRIEPTTAGTYFITMFVHYNSNDGGGEASATVKFVAKAAPTP